jgi:Na+/H+ antiporter NhaD/arsenite permease-like protein
VQPSPLTEAVPALPWAGPFLGVLASIAILPSLAPRFWHRRMVFVAAFWVAAILLPWWFVHGSGAAARLAVHAILVEYLPFVTLLLALYTTGGGVLVRGGVSGTPAGNTGLLAIGTVLAGIMGTTGASMVLIHPLLRANAHRERKVHIAAFFIILVANAGGALSPLGDPPLYLGYLHGVPFLWPAIHLGPPLAVLAGLLLLIFYLLDRVLARKEPAPPARERLHVRGWQNIGLIALVIVVVLMQGDFGQSVQVYGQPVLLTRLIVPPVFVAITLVSIVTTARAVRQGNDFVWHPMLEVALLFVAVFVTIDPVLDMLDAGLSGPFAPVLELLTDAHGNRLPAPFFWLTGTLSAFLDNAPTYLVFFGLAGVEPENVSVTGNVVLQALSAGAVFFGALTYIGNAPNMMIRAIASHRGVRMPGFFAFTAMIAAILLPIFALLTALFFL